MKREPPTGPRPRPLTVERALTAMVQGRKSIEQARRELADSIVILAHLEAHRPGADDSGLERLRRLRRALDQLGASHRQLQASVTLSDAQERFADVG